MNKDRRNRVIEAANILDEAIDAIQEVRDEEEEAFYNLPENFQYSSRGQAMEDAMSELEDLIAEIEELKSKIENFGDN